SACSRWIRAIHSSGATPALRALISIGVPCVSSAQMKMHSVPMAFIARTKTSVWTDSTMWPRWRLPLAYGSAWVTSMREAIRVVSYRRLLNATSIAAKLPTAAGRYLAHTSRRSRSIDNRGSAPFFSSKSTSAQRISARQEFRLPHRRHARLDVLPDDLRAIAHVERELPQLGGDQPQVVTQPVLQLQLGVARQPLLQRTQLVGDDGRNVQRVDRAPAP